MTLWVIYLTSTHPKLSKKYVYYIIPDSLFTFFNLNLQKNSASTGAESVILWRLERVITVHLFGCVTATYDSLSTVCHKIRSDQIICPSEYCLLHALYLQFGGRRVGHSSGAV